MEPKNLSFDALLAYLNQAIVQMQDPRKASNAMKYSLKEAVLAASFSVFRAKRVVSRLSAVSGESSRRQ
jgi:thiazole synthase ThiGH ThiG subunit